MSTPCVIPLSAAPPLVRVANHDTPAKIRQGAQDFEALLLTQMLRAARQASGGGLTGSGDDEDEANSSLVELGEQQFGQALAANGGFGIAKLVVAGLTKHAD
jgi:Rod binding domain-containing protein